MRATTKIIRYTPGSNLKALPGSGYFTTAFAAPLGVAAMATPSQQLWLNGLYEAVRLSDESYYEDTLTLLSMLVMSGNFWGPDTFAAAPVPGLSAGGLALTAVLFIGLYASTRRVPKGGGGGAAQSGTLQPAIHFPAEVRER